VKVVLDTNVLLVSLPRQSKYRLIFEKILDGSLVVIISNDILMEYQEIISLKTSALVAANVTELLINLPNVRNVNIYFNWSLMTNDPTDNKFVDAALSGDADFIVTNDNHFGLLKTLEFPKVKIISLTDFMELIKTMRA
jgi:putative PIN family toxin of toxin-antitoxin system